MNELDPRLTFALELARSDAEPSANDKARVLEVVRARLGAPPVAPLEPRSSSKGTTLGIDKLLTVGVVAGAVGFLAGFGLREQASTARHTDVSAISRPAPIVSPSEATPVAPASAAAAPATMTPIAASHEPRTAAAPPSRKPTPALGGSPAKRRETTATTPRDARGPGLLEALDLLRRAQRALRRNEPVLALALLTELDDRFAPSVLGEERQATRALALCDSGDIEAAKRTTKALLADSPRSIYAARLRKSCTAK